MYLRTVGLCVVDLRDMEFGEGWLCVPSWPNFSFFPFHEGRDDVTKASWLADKTGNCVSFA